MSSPARAPAPDQAERDAAVRERARNVLIDAGAGTGKTAILVDRLVEMVAPTAGNAAVSIARIAAITFTRKAAGELRLRIRERLLEELARRDLTPARDGQLREAVGGLDTAHVGTIHSFADRLLRLRPVEADLSPTYEIAEDTEALVAETVDVLLHAVQSGTLAAELEGTPAAARAEEATRTVLFALAVGLRAASRETEFHVFHGLDGLVAGFVRQRDIPPPDGDPAAFDLAAFRAAAGEMVAAGERLTGASSGARWLRRTAAVLRSLGAVTEPLLILRALRPQLDRVPRTPRKGTTYGGDGAAWDLWKTYSEGGKQRKIPLRDDLCGPLDRWLATRLVRLFPVVVALYERVKTRHRRLDQLDLLIKLRDLLVANLEVRGEFQRLFDHVFVDEFQDTDPLQAEIILLLCEREPAARRWDQALLRPGALTLVGDPKQSIYRFRRADVAMYDRVRQVVAAQDALHATLSANFRSVPSLIGWLNDCFDVILGRSPDGAPFDPATGRVFQQRLEAGRAGSQAPAVHVLPVSFPDGGKHNAEEYRALEGQALARYLRWLVTASGVTVIDPLDGQPRAATYGDVAVLAVSTWNLFHLFPWLDDAGIPYASRGGRLFLQDPLSRQFLLGLRGLADPDDGVAEAALLRPPFFALDPTDLVLERAERAGTAIPEAMSARLHEARALILELRRGRLDRSPGVVALDLLDRTGFARVVALGPNGAQRLGRLRELCLVLSQLSASDGLDFDAVTARMREWAIEPVELDPPHPVGAEAVRILTVHQAKGLEFPVMVLWDGRLAWDTRIDQGAWNMARDERGWTMSLDGLKWGEPADRDLRETEKAYLDAERRRVIYVAATRARDLLVLPRTGAPGPDKLVCTDLLAAAPPAWLHELDPFLPGAEPAWARAAGAATPPEPADASALSRAVQVQWEVAAAEAGRPRFAPAAIAGGVERIIVERIPEEDAESTLAIAGASRAGRFGALFGGLVHRAIGLVLRDPELTALEAVQVAAAAMGRAEHLDEARADVERAITALHAEGHFRALGPDLQIEYAVAGLAEGGRLLSGYVDLVSSTAERLDVIDFKTDAPPRESAARSYPDYVAQVRAYGALLAASGAARDRAIRTGLLFSADGSIHWV